MRRSKSWFRVLVRTGTRWGRNIGEDSGEGACQLCVESCPEIFEKSLPNRCATVRPGVDPTPYLARIRRVAKACPVNAIHLVRSGYRDRGPPLQSEGNIKELNAPWSGLHGDYLIMAFPSFDTATNRWAPQADVSWNHNSPRREFAFIRFSNRFQTEAGQRSLAELFDGRSQLLVFHFMLGPHVDGWPEAGCVGFSQADVALANTGIAGPNPGDDDTPNSTG